MVLGFVCWNIVGLMVGLVVDRMWSRADPDPRPALVAATAGAVLFGMAYGRFSAAGVEVFDRTSLIAAALGAAAASAFWHRRSRRRDDA